MIGRWRERERRNVRWIMLARPDPVITKRSGEDAVVQAIAGRHLVAGRVGQVRSKDACDVVQEPFRICGRSLESVGACRPPCGIALRRTVRSTRDSSGPFAQWRRARSICKSRRGLSQQAVNKWR